MTVLKRATDVGGKCFWKCHRKPESSLKFSLSFHLRFVAHQKLYDMFIFDNSCLIYEKDISLHYTIGKFIISILRIWCKGNITIILKQTVKALLHLCHSECLVNLQKSKHQHSTVLQSSTTLSWSCNLKCTLVCKY